jgi:diaminohydroxyphosphoribosylaminopyrimidine deaminase/5-amino-6-(5-phosphoribosylamino)uracil reductase
MLLSYTKSSYETSSEREMGIWMKEHEYYMKRAIDLALTAKGYTSPNPMVGCIVVKDGVVVAEGCHERYGEYHAERNALLKCKEDVHGAELYVTLEPCCHHGKTPPCTDIIIEKGIKKVYVGSLDSNPLVAGKGVKILQEAGIEVEVGILEAECLAMNEIFYHYIEHQTPLVAMKYAMTLDGKIAAYTGDSKWITCEESRAYVHELRKEYAGIMVGIGTVLADNPMLNCRIAKGVDPIRIVCDSNLRTPLDSNLVKTAREIPVIVAYTEQESIESEDYEALQERKRLLEENGVTCICTGTSSQVDLKVLMQELGKRKIDSVLIEGGASIHASALEQEIVDKVYAFVAPKIIMGETAKSPIGGKGIEKMQNSISLKRVSWKQIGNDICMTGYVK